MSLFKIDKNQQLQDFIGKLNGFAHESNVKTKKDKTSIKEDLKTLEQTFHKKFGGKSLDITQESLSHN